MQAVKSPDANSPSSLFLQFLDAGLELFYPAVCQLCGAERATVKEGFIGPACAKNVTFIGPPFCSRCGLALSGHITNEFICSQCVETPPAFSSARTAVVADAFLLDIIHRYKYGGALYFEPFLANLLLRQAIPSLTSEKWDYIVPVPLHPVKKREREFNQAERLARFLSRATNIPINKGLIQRIEPTRSQTTLNRKQRAENVRGAFAPCRRQLNGETIVLLDDVMTTGATTNACAKALLKAGAGKVCVWAVARGA